MHGRIGSPAGRAGKAALSRAGEMRISFRFLHQLAWLSVALGRIDTADRVPPRPGHSSSGVA